MYNMHVCMITYICIPCRILMLKPNAQSDDRKWGL